MSRDDTFLVDILESAKIALDYVAGKSWDDFYEDMQCQDTVDINQVWDTTQNTLPTLIVELSKIVPPE